MMSIRQLVYLALAATLIVGCKSSTGDAATSGTTADKSAPTPLTPEQATPPASSVTPPKGDGKVHSIVGSWTPTDAPKGVSVTLNFTKDGKWIVDQSGPGPGGKGTVKTVITQSYTQKENAVTSKMLSMVASTTSTEPKVVQGIGDLNARAKANISKAKPNTVNLIWLDADHFAINVPPQAGPNGQQVPGKVVNFQRAK
jgi:hypothetical protein